MRTPVLALALALPAALGCTGSVADTVEAGGAGTTSGVVSIERTTDPVTGARAEATARFLRVTGAASTDDALRAVGAALDLPASGTCAVLSAHAAEGASGAIPIVELLDVGGLSVEAGGSETRLSPRQLPDVTDVVTGVVYSRAVDPALLPAAAGYVVRVAGAPGFEGFEARLTAPEDASDVRVAGEEPAGALAASGASVDLVWSVGGAGIAGGDDLVYVDVRPKGVRCVLADAGRGSLSTALLDETGTLVVHRLHRELLRARGMSTGEVRFDFARSISYVRH